MRTFLLGTAFLAILACLLWSTAFAGIKIGLQYTTPFQFAGVRFFLAGVLLIPFGMRHGSYIKTLRHHSGDVLMVATTQTFIQYALFYWAMSLIPGSTAAITVGAQPFFVALIAHYMVKNDQLTWRKLMAIALGMSGIVLITVGRGLDKTGGIHQLLGVFLLILSNLSSGLGNVLVSRRANMGSPVVLSSLQLMLGGVCLFILSLFFEPFHGFDFPMPYYLALAWLSCLSAIAFTIWITLLQRPGVKVSDLNIWKFIVPVFGAVLSWLLIPNESPDIFAVLGMLIIGISLLLYYLKHDRG